MKILIWGTGRLTNRYLETEELKDSDIIGFIETDPAKTTFHDKTVYKPEDVVKLSYEYILVCVLKFGEVIYDRAVSVGIDTARMIFVENLMIPNIISPADIYVSGKMFRKVNSAQDDEEVGRIFPVLYRDFLKKYNKNEIFASIIFSQRNASDMIDDDDLLQTEEFADHTYWLDYYRFRTFELAANEIIRNHVDGAVAELGVFQGTFSKLINAKFKNRKMYLFDTFESFDNSEFESELKAGNCKESFMDYFRNTSVETVMSNMLYPEQVEVRKGYFPKTLEGMPDEKYAFVSIDVDFEKSMYEGLKYFYPRLSEGGDDVCPRL
jgi:hypothetical protein